MNSLASARGLLLRAHPNFTQHVLNKLIRFRESLPLRRRTLLLFWLVFTSASIDGPSKHRGGRLNSFSSAFTRSAVWRVLNATIGTKENEIEVISFVLTQTSWAIVRLMADSTQSAIIHLNNFSNESNEATRSPRWTCEFLARPSSRSAAKETKSREMNEIKNGGKSSGVN